MIVLSRPSLEPARVARTAFGAPPPATPFADLSHYARGRDAMLMALAAFGLQPGDAVVVPAYICESLVAAVRSAGFAITFVDVEADLRLDPLRLRAALTASAAKVALVVHYFGIEFDIEPLITVCHQAGVPLIEDCCHGFLTHREGRPVGTRGDAAIFSMRKTLPVPDGGALRIGRAQGRQTPNHADRAAPRPPVTRYALGRALEAVVRGLGWPNLYATRVDAWRARAQRAPARASSSPQSGSAPTPQRPSTLLAGFLADEPYLQRIARRIVSNHERLVDGARARGWQPFLAALPDGAVPQWALLDDPSGSLVARLRAHGIGAARWPGAELPAEVRAAPQDYPNSHRLDRRLALLPVHQAIDSKAITWMLRLLDAPNLHRDGSARAAAPAP